MELSQLKIFKTVADHGSISRAATQLHCVPSNITNRIKSLERELGVTLFNKKGRGLVISTAGEILLDYANQIILLSQEASRSLTPNSEPKGLLKIGSIESAAARRLPKLLMKCRQHYPNLQIQLTIAQWPELIDAVINHNLDGAIIANDYPHADLSYTKISEETLVVVSPSTSGSFATQDEVAKECIYMWPLGCPYRKALETWLTQSTVPYKITTIRSYGTIISFIKAGLGISVMPESLFRQVENNPNITGHYVPSFSAVKNHIVWNKNSGPHRLRNIFLEILNLSDNRTP
ncbi:LysR family transcriptional regulator [Pseudomonas entomophila]|uniref:LysR family transcriptional regulator n=1 Tax=Pseudomonas entomophila TaxID=312306 RepID=UPI0015E2BD94|nr:LysR family transcriptional regulator [Pseudomonas entomophila]MBA1190668.1 LysR family transcriptional regulator [Pseudomonas entomophila]